MMITLKAIISRANHFYKNHEYLTGSFSTHSLLSLKQKKTKQKIPYQSWQLSEDLGIAAIWNI